MQIQRINFYNINPNSLSVKQKKTESNNRNVSRNATNSINLLSFGSYYLLPRTSNPQPYSVEEFKEKLLEKSDKSLVEKFAPKDFALFKTRKEQDLAIHYLSLKDMQGKYRLQNNHHFMLQGMKPLHDFIMDEDRRKFADFIIDMKMDNGDYRFNDINALLSDFTTETERKNAQYLISKKIPSRQKYLFNGLNDIGTFARACPEDTQILDNFLKCLKSETSKMNSCANYHPTCESFEVRLKYLLFFARNSMKLGGLYLKKFLNFKTSTGSSTFSTASELCDYLACIGGPDSYCLAGHSNLNGLSYELFEKLDGRKANPKQLAQLCADMYKDKKLYATIMLMLKEKQNGEYKYKDLSELTNSMNEFVTQNENKINEYISQGVDSIKPLFVSDLPKRPFDVEGIYAELKRDFPELECVKYIDNNLITGQNIHLEAPIELYRSLKEKGLDSIVYVGRNPTSLDFAQKIKEAGLDFLHFDLTDVKTSCKNPEYFSRDKNGKVIVKDKFVKKLEQLFKLLSKKNVYLGCEVDQTRSFIALSLFYTLCNPKKVLPLQLLNRKMKHCWLGSEIPQKIYNALTSEQKRKLKIGETPLFATIEDLLFQKRVKYMGKGTLLAINTEGMKGHIHIDTQKPCEDFSSLSLTELCHPTRNW